MSKDDLYKDIPHVLFKGDATEVFLSYEELQSRANVLLQEGFTRIKKKCSIVG